MVRITFLFFSPVMMNDNGNANVGNVNSTGKVNNANGVRPVASCINFKFIMPTL